MPDSSTPQKTGPAQAFDFSHLYGELGGLATGFMQMGKEAVKSFIAPEEPAGFHASMTEGVKETLAHPEYLYGPGHLGMIEGPGEAAGEGLIEEGLGKLKKVFDFPKDVHGDKGGPRTLPDAAIDTHASQVVPVHNENGSTYNLRRGHLEEGYSVATHPDREEVIHGELKPEHTADFIRRNQDLLKDPNKSLGTWKRSDNEHVLDVVSTPTDKTEAIQLGKQHGQDAIFDLNTKQEIPLRNRSLSDQAQERFGVSKTPGGANKAERHSFVTPKGEVITVGRHDRIADVMPEGQRGGRAVMNYMDETGDMRVGDFGRGMYAQHSPLHPLSDAQIEALQDYHRDFNRGGNVALQTGEAEPAVSRTGQASSIESLANQAMNEHLKTLPPVEEAAQKVEPVTLKGEQPVDREAVQAKLGNHQLHTIDAAGSAHVMTDDGRYVITDPDEPVIPKAVAEPAAESAGRVRPPKLNLGIASEQGFQNEEIHFPLDKVLGGNIADIKLNGPKWKNPAGSARVMSHEFGHAVRMRQEGIPISHIGPEGGFASSVPRPMGIMK